MRGMSRATTKPDLGAWRRQRAWELHQAGWWSKDIAAALGVSRAAVSQWLKRGREGGEEALRTRPSPGATPTAERRAAGPDSGLTGARSRGLWLWRRRVDG
ncbi:MAG: helix-turn-helix domain-containing protein [Ktedonobacterales bacterium]|jgi:transposase-like protein